MKTTHYKKTKIAYTDTIQGTGIAVVLLHGFLENSTMWNAFVPELSKKYRIVTIDLLGHGKTECLGYVHTMEDQALVVHHVLKELEIKKAVLIGHSMGGYVALAFAELFPSKIKGVLLQNSTSFDDSEDKKINRDRAIYAVKQNYKNFVSISVANLFTEDSRDTFKEEIENVKIEALKTPLQGIIAALEGMKIRKNRQTVLQHLAEPIHIVLGKKDGILNYREHIKQVENTLATVSTFSDGHMSHIENKEQLLKVILDFLKTI